MLAVDQLVVYGGEGVCRVGAIGPSPIPGADKNRLYYTLLPLYRTGQVLTPVDTRVLLRPIITAQEAHSLIAALPQQPSAPIPAGNPRLLKDFYQRVVTSYDCAAMAALLRCLHSRRAAALQSGKKPSQMDERYAKRCEDQLYGELGAALGLPRAAVADHIRTVHPTWPVL